jgi:BlaI family penicillinase repressor
LPRKKISDPALTPLELQIMNVLWETGPGNVQAVQANLKGRELAYTTVQTMLNVLHRKGKVKRVLKNRTYIYRPVLSRQKAVTQAVGEMLDRFFGGSADGLVLNLVETRQLTPEKLARIQEIIDQPNSDRPNSEPKEETHGND